MMKSICKPSTWDVEAVYEFKVTLSCRVSSKPKLCETLSHKQNKENHLSRTAEPRLSNCCTDRYCTARHPSVGQTHIINSSVPHGFPQIKAKIHYYQLLLEFTNP